MERLNRLIYLLLIFLALIGVIVSFYVFSRLTIDDAFITWRYGRNLIEAGIWGYNPSMFDLTQAYTNPLLAVLSILPAWLKIDTVLFFKILALGSLILPLLFLRTTRAHKPTIYLLYGLLLALPATMIHAFAGLETFAFAAALGLMFIALAEGRAVAATAFAWVLLFLRPEAWLLVALLPAWLLFANVSHQKDLLRWQSWRQPVVYGAILLSSFALYAWWHWQYFGYVLPNSFYIKVKSGLIFYYVAKFGLFFGIPFVLLFFSAQRRLMPLIAGFYLPIIYSYSSSDLQMDYSERFAFHIFAPLYLLLAYVWATPQPGSRWLKCIAMPGVLLWVCVFVYLSAPVGGLVHMANYYPRLQQAHGALGKWLHSEGASQRIRVFALSDAGFAAFRSRMVALDNNGLGSALVAHSGISHEVVERYAPDVVVLRADASGVVLSNRSKQVLHDWAMAKGYKPRCDIYLKTDYKLRVFSGADLKGIGQVCARSSEENNREDSALFRKQIVMPPWHFWRE